MPAKQRVFEKIDSDTLYKKVGGKYVAVRSTIEFIGWSEGFYLVHVCPNSRSMRAAISPDFAELECAYAILGEEITKAMHEAGSLKLTSSDDKNPELVKTWAKIKKALGKKMPNYFEYASLHEIVEKGFKGFITKYKEFLAKAPKCEEVEL